MYILTASMMLFLLSSASARPRNSSGMEISVTPAQDGLCIVKSHDKKYTHATVHVESDGMENFSLEAQKGQDRLIYPFVEEGKTYTVYVSLTDKDMKDSIVSQPVSVTATGGLGDLSLSCSQIDYENDTARLMLRDYILSMPDVPGMNQEGITGTIFYDCNEDFKWNSTVTGKFSQKDGSVDISRKLSSFANSRFFVELQWKFSYQQSTFVHKLCTRDTQKLFTDIHPVTHISVPEGLLFPVFNPARKQYVLRGTQNPQSVTFTYTDGTSTTSVLSPDSPLELHGYKVTFEEPEFFTFEGQEYIETFFDDFEGDQLDATKWKRSREQERQPSMKRNGWWKDECSYLDGKGNLVIEAKEKDGQLISGSVETEGIFEQSHGFYEIKFRCQKTSGLWYAFWLMGQNNEEHIGNGAADAAEIDIFELISKEAFVGRNSFRTTVHWDGYGKEHRSYNSGNHLLQDSFYDQWHVAQFVWGDEDYSLYLDGKHMWTLSGIKAGGMCQGRNWMILSAEFGVWGGPLVKDMLPAKMHIDYVKAGLPLQKM